MSPRHYFVLGSLALFLAAMVWAQYRQYDLARDYEESSRPLHAPPQTEYAFTRVVYRSISAGNWGWRRNSWSTDYPKADRQFVMGVKRLSLIETLDGPVTPMWNEPRLFQYPILYAVEVGHMDMDDQEAARLREFLGRGGFFVVDDFHGDFEWDVFETAIRKVFPERFHGPQCTSNPDCPPGPIQEVDIQDQVFHCFFDINEKIQVPGVQYLRSGDTSEHGGVTPHYRGIYDDKGRLIVMINHNMDLGDAWEWADLPEYEERYTGTAYRLGINYIIYSMTH